jgi:hypothetical protein
LALMLVVDYAHRLLLVRWRIVVIGLVLMGDGWGLSVLMGWYA